MATGAVAYQNAYFGRGTGPILLDDLVCSASEARLIDCPRTTSQGIGTYDNCPNGHGDDAGVRCGIRKYNYTKTTAMRNALLKFPLTCFV